MRVKITVDQMVHEVEQGDNLLHACLSAGLDIPYFCWHPALGSVGSCRQCAVKSYKDDDDQQGRMVMSCMESATDGLRISIDDPEAKDFRQQVIEWLMTNHPHDCPVCDEGGECHLQDMTVQTGHDYRRYRFDKRTHRNQDLGPLINHEMNRCIACYRCVRFYDDYAGGDDLRAFGAHNHVYFGRHEDGVLESEFSGNLVEVCPTGVFTDKTLKQHYTRKWDLHTAPSVCVHCGLGCNTIAGERYGELRRILNRYHEDINGYFLCDRGRFGYEFVNSERRVREPFVRDPADGELAPASPQVALECVASFLAAGDKRPIGIGSPRASVENNFALRELVGADRFFAGTSQADFELVSVAREILTSGPALIASIADIQSADAVFVLGEDPTDTAPMLSLALRQSVRRQPLAAAAAARMPEWHDAAVRNLVQEELGPLFLATPDATRLDDIATETFRAAPDDLARLGFAVAHELDSKAPKVDDLSDDIRALAKTIAKSLREANHPVVVSGTGAGSEAVLRAAGGVATALAVARKKREEHRSQIFLTVPECNSLGLALIGGKPLDQAFELVAAGSVDTAIVLENDLYRRADKERVDAFFAATDNVVVIDHLSHETSRHASVFVPAATFAEGDGTLVNNEGRAQPFYQVFVPKGDINDSWRWIRDVANRAAAPAGDGAGDGAGVIASWHKSGDVRSALAAALPVFACDRLVTAGTLRYAQEKVPRGSHRDSGRTAMNAGVDVHEPEPPDDPDSCLAFSMEGHTGPESPLTPSYWAPAWNSVQALNKFQHEVGGALRGGDPGQRLLAPDANASVSYSTSVPDAFERRKDEWLLTPRHYVFGSDEVSQQSPAVSQRAPEMRVALNSEDAADLGVSTGDAVEIRIQGRDAPVRFPVELRADLVRGVVAVPVGVSVMQMNAYARLMKGDA